MQLPRLSRNPRRSPPNESRLYTVAFLWLIVAGVLAVLANVLAAMF